MLLNTALLTATSLLMRGVAMVFQVWLSKRIGAAGIGLFQLIMSVASLAATFAISGIRFAATRLISMELGAGSGRGARAAIKRCLVYAVCFGTAAGAVLYLGAPTIGYRWIGDARTVLSLRVLSLSLPCFAMTAVLSGYFTAVCRVAKSASAQIAEQVIRIAVIIVALTASAHMSLEMSCAVIVAGGVAGEIAAFVMLFVLYKFDQRRIPNVGGTAEGVTRRMFGIALPLAVSAYARTALTTLQNLLVPRGFRKSGASSENALADYGMITGMVFPIITFPQAFFSALSEMIVPELTDAEVRGDTTRIKMLMKRTLTYGLLFSTLVMVLLIGFSDFLGNAIYNSAQAGRYIRQLAWIVPVMYTDSVTDGMLRGLGLQVYSMGVNIADSAVSVVLVWFLLPRYGVAGYVFVVYFSEIFNFVLSIGRLIAAARKLGQGDGKSTRVKQPKIRKRVVLSK
jgi:stage V sporulation protein B